MADPTRYEAQLTLSKALARALAQILVPFVGLPTKPNNLAKAVFPAVSSAWTAQRDLAELHYGSSKRKALGEDAELIPRPDIRPFTEDDMRSVVVAITMEDAPFTQDNAESLITSSDSIALRGSRNQTLAYSFADGDVLGWARVARYPNPCSFCRLLISRGPVYKTARSAGSRNEFHKGDRCEVVLVYRGQRDSYPGRDQYLTEKKRYDRLTDGLSGKEAAKAYRAGVQSLNGGDKPGVAVANDRVSELNSAATKERDRVQTRISALEKTNPSTRQARDYKNRTLAKLRNQLDALGA